ncbi:hypothetical protein BST95_04990 [Halioglobus japonicus]|uniref:Alpha/beta hydrolase n=1 Tax=Halioglobus japonicus TaxID=930805 RepID=A0AAP8SMQ0_9GAMM|nr:alpha/beta hydrolase [Halioglobus japonicus]AQA17687.1 hypothetical protein BST95_04990 [Halioglobus japonicus]PLW85636.1 alpha/beta hydrolase [Halioglobus japonicus]GHD16668.1 hypothetical protein GCM10007052_22350 [Halioglobus japonicus]
MQLLRVLAPVLLGATLVACSDSSDSSRPSSPAQVPRPTLDLTFTTAPIDLPNISAKFSADVPYGDDERNLFDIYLPECDDPTPLVIYIHGGGFTGGDKSSAHNNFADDVRAFLQECVAYATINYTLLTVPEEGGDIVAAAEQGGVLTSLQDTAQALQFMRYYYESLNLDVDNVALYGVSAGAGASLWLGTRDDLADPDNADEILRESTRVSAVGALVTQSTYDIIDWGDVLLPLTAPLEDILGSTDILTLVNTLGQTNYLLTFLGVPSVEALEDQATLDYRAEVDMLELMDAGDAPIYVENFTTSLENPVDLFLHHALHGIAIKERADEVGLESVGYSRDPAWPLEDPSGEELVPFLLRHIR